MYSTFVFVHHSFLLSCKLTETTIFNSSYYGKLLAYAFHSSLDISYSLFDTIIIFAYLLNCFFFSPL